MPQGVVLGQAAAQPARTQRGRAGHKVHGGGVGSLVGYPRPRGEGSLGELPASTARRARIGVQRHWAASNPTTALDEKWTSILKQRNDDENIRERRGKGKEQGRTEPPQGGEKRKDTKMMT